MAGCVNRCLHLITQIHLCLLCLRQSRTDVTSECLAIIGYVYKVSCMRHHRWRSYLKGEGGTVGQRAGPTTWWNGQLWLRYIFLQEDFCFFWVCVFKRRSVYSSGSPVSNTATASQLHSRIKPVANRAVWTAFSASPIELSLRRVSVCVVSDRREALGRLTGTDGEASGKHFTTLHITRPSIIIPLE